MGASWLLLHGAALMILMAAAAAGLKVAIKCKNGSSEEYESKAVGELDGAGAFAVPLAADLRGADCVAQLHSAATDAPCPGQEPSKIEPLSSEGTGTFVAVAGKTLLPSSTSSSPECSSVAICFPCHRRHHMFHRKPMPEYQPPPSPVYGTPAPGCSCSPPSSTPPGYGQPAPECPPADPGYGQPAPECPPPPTPAPECGQPEPEYPPPTPAYGTPAPECPPSTPEYGTPATACPPPTAPGYGSPSPFWPPVSPAYGTPSPTPIYRPPGSH
uniref:Uncharacterized protein n=1 Tax=Oryza nivara TaxID=4536 RepID=A0A0E0IVA4_ORYNI